MPTPDLFYPQHFKKSRPYAKDFVEEIEALAASNMLTPKSSHALVARHILGTYKTQGVDVANLEFNTQAFTVETQAALIYGEWAQRGAALYAFKQPLTEALMATGLGEVAIADLHFPFNCAYFHFGAQPGLLLESGAAVTGAYLLLHEGQALRIFLTAPLAADTSWPERWNEIYDLRIQASHFNKDVESAIAHALADDAEDLRQAAETISNAAGPRAAEGKASAEALLESHTANQATFTRCLQLIVNAICYVTAFPEDAKNDWQTGTPEKMKNKAEAGPPKEAGRAVSKLNAMGYRKAWYIGGEFSAAGENVEGGHVAPHWRRGHWRSQAHGPQMSLRKLIWLKPTRVLGGAASDEPRIYSTTRPAGS
jgi:hypothetical protein